MWRYVFVLHVKRFGFEWIWIDWRWFEQTIDDNLSCPCNLTKPTRIVIYSIHAYIQLYNSKTRYVVHHQTIKFITCFRSRAWNMEPCPWSAKLPFSYILNVWESGTQAQDLHISSYRNLPFQSSVHCRTKLPCMVSWWHHIMTSLDLWSKKKHLSKAGCNYGLLPSPRHLLHPNRKKYSGIDLWSIYELNSATGTKFIIVYPSKHGSVPNLCEN